MTVWSIARATECPHKDERLHVGDGRRCASDKTTHAFDLPRVEAHERPFLRANKAGGLLQIWIQNRATNDF